jgi:chemotaxis protein histidine kinase CheA
LDTQLQIVGHSPIALVELGNDPELLGDFALHAREHLSEIDLRLVSLEPESVDPEALNAICRGFHTIQVLAGFLNLSAIAAVAHEVALKVARTSGLPISAEHLLVILTASDDLSRRICELSVFLRTGQHPEKTALLFVRHAEHSLQQNQDHGQSQ